MKRKKTSLKVKETGSGYKIFNRITFDPAVLSGQACVRSLRIPVSLLVNLIAQGMTIKNIIKEYPEIEPEDITQALQYAAWLTREEVHSVIE